MWIIHHGPYTFVMFLWELGECITNYTPMESVCSTCNLIPRCGGGGERALGLHLHLITVATSLHVYIVQEIKNIKNVKRCRDGMPKSM